MMRTIEDRHGQPIGRSPGAITARQLTTGPLAPASLPGRFMRYGFASASGTVIDLAAFALLVWGGIGAGFAAAIGYALGTLWHWQVSSRMVFADRLADPGTARRRQHAMFFASALLGLALTTAIVTLGVMQGFAPGYAKFAAMFVAFTSVWLIRLSFVFSER